MHTLILEEQKTFFEGKGAEVIPDYGGALNLLRKLTVEINGFTLWVEETSVYLRHESSTYAQMSFVTGGLKEKLEALVTLIL